MCYLYTFERTPIGGRGSGAITPNSEQRRAALEESREKREFDNSPHAMHIFQALEGH